ncbi:pentapeptide repeat-containing protein [Thalassospira sp. A3_1]|uniref:pentapeptide repeat-containing protein n=1 Tax=Thalassospira sp. A3_1 TaxID=2821088 RepID=UPI001ADB7AC4|nr:pentapeptide repeat-containing protein [Thalassospira sp. A3_1]MBO9506245.1 pentapeptide repeat-containing protein [Thalassospira sp. A3_1]
MTSRSQKKLSVLYADYSDRNIKAVRTALEPLDLAAFHTSDNRESIVELAQIHRPDLILIGLYLDGIRGISTIRTLRQSASEADPFCNQVPVLLGAPKLDRRAMHDAVSAGIEGVFRQPVDDDRLRKIVQTVIRKPRRFVFEGNYFGPAREGDNLAEPSRKTRPSASVTIKPAPQSKISTRVAASVTGKPASRFSSPKTDNPVQNSARPATGAIGIETAEIASEKSARDYNLDAASSVREVLGTLPIPDETALPVADTAPIDTAIDEELVEIDLMTALQGHRLWVDTGGKEGAMMSIEHADLRDADLEGIDLTRCALPHVSFRNANCQKAVLRRCDMTAGDFIGCNLDQAVLAASRLAGARFTDAILRNTVFLGSDLSGASFRGMTLHNCDLSGANLAKTDFRDADLSSAKGLFAEQIQRARVNANTRLPRNMTLKE